MSTISFQKRTGRTSPGVRLWLQWTAATTLGELAGFAVPALVGSLMVALDLDDLVVSMAIVIAGAFEGAILGSFQWMVLRHYFPKMRWAEWSLATMIAAVLAYFGALTPYSLGDLTRFNWLILALGTLVLGLIFLFSMGFCQWVVLRHYLPGSALWITANVFAWPLGVLIPVIGIMLVPDDAPATVFAMVGISCGLLMGLTVGVITGGALVRIYRNYLSATGSGQEV